MVELPQAEDDLSDIRWESWKNVKFNTTLRKMNKHNCRQIRYFCISCLSICYKLYGTLDNRWFVIKEGPRLRSRNYHSIQISERDQIQIRHTVTLPKRIRMINFLFVTTAIIIVSRTNPQETDSATVVVISFILLHDCLLLKKRQSILRSEYIQQYCSNLVHRGTN